MAQNPGGSFMEQTFTGKDKVKQICDILKKETLEPAKEEARVILEEAKKQRESILADAKAKSKQMLAETDQEIEKRQAVFKASLNQGARQAVEWLKQEIRERLLQQDLGEKITQATSDPALLADIVKALVKAVGDEGLDTDLSATIASAVEPRQVNELIGKQVLETLREKSVVIGPQKVGVELKLHGEKITIDFSDRALLELMIRYVRKDFHQFFFAKK